MNEDGRMTGTHRCRSYGLVDQIVIYGNKLGSYCKNIYLNASFFFYREIHGNVM